MSRTVRDGRRFGWGLTLVLVLGAAGIRAQDPDEPNGDEAPAGAVVGDRSKRVFHRADCAALKRVPARLRSELADAESAASKGFKPCPVCKPTDAADGAAPEVPAPKGRGARRNAGDGSLKFSRDIAPILAANCTRCHNPNDKARRKNFDLSTFAGLRKGGDDGPVIVPGKPEDSPLILRVKGELTPKMPPGQVNLGEAAIARLEQWIKAGAPLDEGIDPNADLSRYAPSAEELRRLELAKKSPAELDQQTEAVGRERWKKASSAAPMVAVGGRFLLFSTLPPDRAKALLKTLDAQANTLRGFLQANRGPLAGPEKISLYVFGDAKGYIEFVRANEGREVEPGTEAHANLGVESPYLAAVDPLKGADEPAASKRRTKKDEEPGGPDRTLAGLLAEQLAAGAVAAAGQAPRWLSLGLGASMASAVEPRSPYYHDLRGRAFDLYRQGWMTKTRELLGGEGDAEQIRAAGFSLIEFLSATNRAFLPPFAHAMIQDNKQFDTVIQKNLGATPEQFFRAWGQFVVTRYGRGR
jgi:hypothetical protein